MRFMAIAVTVFAILSLQPGYLAAAELSPPKTLIRLPKTRQATDYTCGAAALQSILGYYGEDVREEELAKALSTNAEDGTRYAEIVRYVTAKGYVAAPRQHMTVGDLKQLLNKKTPVLCLIQAWAGKPTDYAVDWEDGHYVVAIGHDGKNIYFMDPSILGHYGYLSEDEFVKRWHDKDAAERLVHFGMAITKDTAPSNINTVMRIE